MADYNLKAIFEIVDRATKPLQKVGHSLGKVTTGVKKVGDKFKEMSRKAIASLKKMGDGLKRLGAGIGQWAKRIGIGLAGIAIGAFKMSMDFNKAMANVATLIPGNLKRVNELKKGVQKLAIESGKSTSDLSDGLYQVVSAFGDSASAMDQLRITSKAAIAGVSTTKESLNLLSAVTKGYGDTSKEAMEKAADLAFTTVKLGQTTFPELAASMGRVIPLAAQLGVSQEELFTGFATLTGVTGNASEVSTQFAAIMRAMLKPTEDMKKAVNSLGYESASTMLKEEGMVGSLTKLMKYTNGNEEATAGLFGRAEALTAVFALSGKQLDDYNKKLKEHERSSGVMNRAYREQTEGVNKAGFGYERMKAALSVLMQDIGDKLSPAFERLSLAFVAMTEKGTVFMKFIKTITKHLNIFIKNITDLFEFLGQKEMKVLTKIEKTEILKTKRENITSSKVTKPLSVVPSLSDSISDQFKMIKKKKTKLKEIEGIEELEPTTKKDSDFPISEFIFGKFLSDQFKKKTEADKTEVEVKLKVYTDDNSNVKVEQVDRKKGSAGIKIISEVGRTIPALTGGY